MYKKALNSFFLKVHPDFFHHNREQQVVNERAVAQLNELLSWAREFKAGTLRAPPSTTISFTFYQRHEENENAGSDGAGEGRVRSSFAQRGFPSEAGSVTTPLHSRFELPENFIPSEANRGVVERAVNKFLRDLLRRADCIDAVAENISAAADATAAREEARPLRRRPRRRTHSGKAGGKDGSNGGDEEEGEVGSTRSLLDEAAETMSMRWTLTVQPTVEELIEADQILLARQLAPAQCAAALQTLRTHLGEMRYASWEAMPLVISDHFGLGEEVTGSVVVPWDFTLDQFRSFLAHNAVRVEACRAAAMSFATDIERLITDLCNALALDDVLISCAHTAALPTLQLLHRNRELLHGHGITELTLEIADRCATRANGVVLVSHTLHTLQDLHDWLRALQPKLELQKKLYKTAKRLLETTLWHLKEFRAVIAPAGVDAFRYNDHTYAQRLAWAKELYRIAPALAQWDWSEHRFVLSEELDLDWTHGQLALPYNFDGDALVRYVEDIQREAKQRQHAELLKASAMQNAAEQEALARQHDRELLLGDSPQEEGSEAGTRDAQGTHAGPNAREEARRVSALREMYRRTSPHLEEYLVSSEDRVDPLSTERPLSHAVTFNSDTEAEEQLKWEGFYQSSFVDQVPTSDLDDVAQTYIMTNRWHREAAAKKLVEQLQSTYNKKGRRFDYKKMGDVLEVNNARVQPKGFPVLVRGLRPGES